MQWQLTADQIIKILRQENGLQRRVGDTVYIKDHGPVTITREHVQQLWWGGQAQQRARFGKTLEEIHQEWASGRPTIGFTWYADENARGMIFEQAETHHEGAD